MIRPPKVKSRHGVAARNGILDTIVAAKAESVKK
jgi:hypothetical protein